MDDAMYKNFLVELECPVCTRYMAPPIRQCATGHSICEQCRMQLKKCPLCQSDFTEARNLSLEGLASRMQYPCINQGCPAKLTLTNRDYHEKNCGFQSYRCAMENCGWSGPLHEITNHWEQKQLPIKIYKSTTLCHTKITPNTSFINLVNANNELYWFKCRIIQGMIYFAVQFIGLADKSESYYYEIEVFKPGHPKRRLLLGDYCQSAQLDDNALFQPGACSYIGVNSLDNYIGIDKMMIYNLRVHVVGNKGSNQPPIPPLLHTNPFPNSHNMGNQHQHQNRQKNKSNPQGPQRNQNRAHSAHSQNKKGNRGGANQNN